MQGILQALSSTADFKLFLLTVQSLSPRNGENMKFHVLSRDHLHNGASQILRRRGCVLLKTMFKLQVLISTELP
jgi:hypothetical protein